MDDDTCGGPSGIVRPDPLPVEGSSSVDPPQVPSLTSTLAPIVTSAPSADPSSVPVQSSHKGRVPITDPLTIIPFPTAQTSDPLTTSVPTTVPSDPTPTPSASEPFANSTTAGAPSDPATAAPTSESAASATSLPTTVPNPPASPSGLLRGVNIGNWLVIEPWMDNGSLLKGKFQGVPDQWTFDGLDKDGSAIKAHWDSWFTEADVQKIKSFGFNALRIPIGYWAIDNSGTPYNKGAGSADCTRPLGTAYG